MATKITNAALIAAGKELLAYIQSNVIPYVANGMTLEGMDCQGMLEYLLIQAGVPKKECGLAGSNAHYRAAAWRGTPEELKKILGAVPAGAAPIIWEESGEPDKYATDGLGNATHVGLYLGGDQSIAASASREHVVQSNFKGKTVPNGGWNRVILLPWVDYGLSAAQAEALGMSGTGTAAQEDSGEEQTTTATETATASGPEDTSGFARIDMAHKCKGGAVRRLQNWLNTLYLNRGTVDTHEMLVEDGEFGPRTDDAVREFQEKQGLEVDGVVGKKTWAALAKARFEETAEAQG
ncbi:MAG: peptidoglycan-binding protein [Eubacteriales bacterium]|nr:peptidoglycan-binding protein [Eubacteriales bacterium]